jgi:arylsulfatase A-like enzyme
MSFRQQLAEVIPAVRDPRLNLVFLHISVPHWPPIYDAAKASFSTRPGGTYLDNLALVDLTLGEIRQTLEQARTWESSTILLTADHPLRVEMWRSMHHSGLPADAQQSARVPFLLKMAGENHGVDYPRAIQTVVTKDLLLAIMNGKVTTAEQVGVWLDGHPPRR